MFIFFPFALIASFFGRFRGGNIIYRLCVIWADIWFPLIGIRNQIIYESPHDETKSYIIICNHISYLDAANIFKVFRKPLRPLAKVEMQKIPVFGFIYRMVSVSVDRSSAAHRAKSLLLLKSFLKKGISVLVFPEGTFNTGHTPLKEFYDGAFRLAIEMQTSLKPVLFLDSYRRMPGESLFRMSPGLNRILFLEEIPVNGYTIEDVKKLKEQAYRLMEKKLTEYHYVWRNDPCKS
ncbi:MAG: 1-acyl-sn-glycerol-3-phosphate acyltransferase [Chitinophagaceae bacterium]|nr:1-acyl-sn-glycerol-3-phosphate acyltransferase [Chitinophagaceae bacterium]